MATPATSSFRPPRKFSVTVGSPAYGPPSSSSSAMAPFSSSGQGMSPTSHLSTAGPTLSASSPTTLASAGALNTQGSRNVSSADGGIGASLIGPGGALLQNGAPVAANSIANKPAVAGSGLYQSCVVLRERLWCVPNFGDRHLSEDHANNNIASTSARPGGMAIDPVSQLFDVFRKGTSLVELYNLLDPAKPLPTDLGESGSSANACKKLVAKFIIALKDLPGFDAEEMFTVMQVYGENTNDWVKVVRVVSKVIDKLEERGILIASERATHFDDMSKPCDDRAWIVKELIESERKYVQDLEVLQSCARALQQYNILSTDRIHDLFCNVNNLVDFQRRCLINLEDNARKAPNEQRFGRAFKVLESNFAVYWPFCSNYAKALEVIAEEAINIQQLRGLPAAEGCYLDPAYELPAFLIKPVQRICKYPLLLEQLLKKSDPAGPYYDELREGLAVVQRGAAKVNEVRREQENKQVVADLQSRVEDWKGHNTETFGTLLLSEAFMVSKGDTEREYLVYLFERILLCCKEVVPNPAKKPAKSNSLLKQRTNLAGAPKKTKTSLQLKGRIFINNVTGAIAEQTPTTFASAHSLIVQWKGDMEYESFSLRCKNEEQLKQWQVTLTKAVDEAARRQVERDDRERAMIDSTYFSETSPINMAGAGANGRRNTGPSTSVFPQTPISECGHVYPFNRADSQMGPRPSPVARLGDDEDASGHSSAAMHSFSHSSSGGRATPASAFAMTRFSQPAEQRARQFSLSAEQKPRAMTEDAASVTLSQWRSHSPHVAPPPLPRQASSSVTGSGPEASQHTLRKASSSRQLRQNSATGQPRMMPRHLGDTGHLDASDMYSPYDSNKPVTHPAVGRHRGEFNAVPPAPSMMMRAHSDNPGQLMMRSRSASTSQVAPPLHYMQNLPPVPRSQPGNGLGPEQLHINIGYGAGRPSGPSAQVGVVKRSSNSSNSTMDSAQSGASRPGSTAASSPLTMSAGSSAGGSLSLKGPNGMPAVPQRSGSYGAVSSSGRMSSPVVTGNVVKVQVHHGGDVYVLVVLANINFSALLEKVVVKIRVCGGSKDLNEGNVKLRYVDEDGDRVAMHDDDDVQMAFEHSKVSGEDVVLYVA